MDSKDPGAPADNPETEPTEAEPANTQVRLSYEGAKVPYFVVLIWLIFFVWGVVYFLRFIPESVREWFQQR